MPIYGAEMRYWKTVNVPLRKVDILLSCELNKIWFMRLKFRETCVVYLNANYPKVSFVPVTFVEFCLCNRGYKKFR